MMTTERLLTEECRQLRLHAAQHRRQQFSSKHANNYSLNHPTNYMGLAQGSPRASRMGFVSATAIHERKSTMPSTEKRPQPGCVPKPRSSSSPYRLHSFVGPSPQPAAKLRKLDTSLPEKTSELQTGKQDHHKLTSPISNAANRVCFFFGNWLAAVLSFKSLHTLYRYG